MVTENRLQRSSGFTLIESVVALLIVALGMTALFMQLNQFASNAIYLQDKTLASWIGSNVVTEYSLQLEWPELGDEEEDIDYANREWHLQIDVQESPVEGLRRIDVAVSLADDPDLIIHQVSGLIEPPSPPGFPPVSWERAPRAGLAVGRMGGPGQMRAGPGSSQ